MSPDLRRFVEAQDRAATYEQALSEIRTGRKRTHWMWFVFPQLAGLGRSPTARFFALQGIEEARAYASHPVLGARLRACVEQLDALQGRSAVEIFGDVDAMKLRSSLTLFTRAVPDEPLFQRVLQRYCGEPDLRTLEVLDGSS